VTRIRRFRVRSTPHEHFVVVNLGVMTMFERKRKVGVELQPRYMGEPVDPSLGIRLRAFYWAHVVGFPVIIPRNNLDHVDFIPHLDDLFPPADEEMVVSLIDPILVPRIGTVMSKEPWRHGSHKCPSAKMMEVVEIGIEFW